MKRFIIRVQWSNGAWRIKFKDMVVAWQELQRNAVQIAVKEARARLAEGLESQVVLHNKNGRIRWERTYPRSADPRRSRG